MTQCAVRNSATTVRPCSQPRTTAIQLDYGVTVLYRSSMVGGTKPARQASMCVASACDSREWRCAARLGESRARPQSARRPVRGKVGAMAAILLTGRYTNTLTLAPSGKP